MSINFFWAIGASIIVSLISLIGIFTLLLKENLLHKLLFMIISFSAGGLIGGAFLHLLPEALENYPSQAVFFNLIVGFVFFFIMERYLHWRHCHEGVCSVHVFTYLNLFGDAVHNFIDGLVIGSSFLINVHFGIVTALVIIFHEIPQEIGDFGVLIYGGFSKSKALYYNFLTALTCVVGTICGFFLSENIANFAHLLLPFTAGGFIYIGACDLIPEIHKQSQSRKSVFAIVAFILGVIFIMLARALGTH